MSSQSEYNTWERKPVEEKEDEQATGHFQKRARRKAQMLALSNSRIWAAVHTSRPPFTILVVVL
jgi:hypothetical protein